MFNETILSHFLGPYHRGITGHADAVGQQGLAGEGPYMAIALLAEGNRIAEGYFETYNCPAAIACASWLMKWIAGKTPAQAQALEASDLSAALGGLPLGKEHCAQLALDALRSALSQLSMT